MQITKDRFTSMALSYVEPGEEYETDDVVIRVAIEMAEELRSSLGIDSLSISSIYKLREVMREAALHCIDWRRLNRKVHPDEYADLMKDGYWPKSLGAEHE